MHFLFCPLKILKDQDFFCGIIDDPVTILSFRLKLNASEFQIMNSSENLDICIEQTDTEYKKSKAKSLSEIVSIELFVGLLNFNFFVV